MSDVLGAIEGVDGWLSEDQALRLAERARGRVLEIGSFHGRSTIVLAQGADAVIAIDPHAGNDRGPREIRGRREQGELDRRAFEANIEKAGVADRVRHLRLPSRAALDRVDGELDLLYIDGAHRYRPARDDIALWGARVKPGGTMMIHDAFSSVGVTLAILRLLVFAGDFEYAGRTRSLAEYRRTSPGAPERALSAARQVAQLPWFLRNVTIKAALVLGLTALAESLGHRRGDPWPY